MCEAPSSGQMNLFKNACFVQVGGLAALEDLVFHVGGQGDDVAAGTGQSTER